MSYVVRTSPVVSVTTPSRLHSSEDSENRLRTTPLSTKRPRLMILSQGVEKQRKNVRFADACDEILPPPTEFVWPTSSLSSDEITGTDADNQTMSTEQNKLSGGRTIQPPSFVKTSPRKNISTDLPRSSTSAGRASRTPSPLTPLRSAIKRKAQESLDSIEHSAQRVFRSPGTIYRMALPDTNIEASQDECLYPSLRRCTDGVTSLCMVLAELSRTSMLARWLREMGITTVGKFASLTPAALEQIPYIKKPKYENAINYLRAHNPINMERESSPSSQTAVTSSQVEIKEEDQISPSPEHGAPFYEEDSQRLQPPSQKGGSHTKSATSIQEEDQRSTTAPTQQLSPSAKTAISIEQQTTPVRKAPSPIAEDDSITVTKISVEQQTSPKRRRPIDFELDDDTTPDITSSQVGNVLKKKVADLTRLVNGAFPENSKKPNLTMLESVRELYSTFNDQAVARKDCSELMNLLLDFAKKVNEKMAESTNVSGR